jgi:hypothetical protein
MLGCCASSPSAGMKYLCIAMEWRLGWWIRWGKCWVLGTDLIMMMVCSGRRGLARVSVVSDDAALVLNASDPSTTASSREQQAPVPVDT